MDTDTLSRITVNSGNMDTRNQDKYSEWDIKQNHQRGILEESSVPFMQQTHTYSAQPPRRNVYRMLCSLLAGYVVFVCLRHGAGQLLRVGQIHFTRGLRVRPANIEHNARSLDIDIRGLMNRTALNGRPVVTTSNVDDSSESREQPEVADVRMSLLTNCLAVEYPLTTSIRPSDPRLLR
jgi:hypothetical protein